MALSKTITKKSVVTIMPKLFNITFNFVLGDTEGEGFNRDFSVEFHQGDNIASKVAKVVEDMQKAVDDYKAQQAILKAAALDTAVTSISNGVSL